MNVESNLIDWASAPDGTTQYVPESPEHYACWVKPGFSMRVGTQTEWVPFFDKDRQAVEAFAIPRPVIKEVWSRDGLDGNWNFDSLAELIKSDYGHGSDSAGPMDDDGSLQIGDIVHRGIKCFDDPAHWLPDADDVANHMFDQAGASDAGQWADNYPDLSKEAEAALKAALEPLKAWARKHAQPTFFTVEQTTTHELTEEDVRAAMAQEIAQ